MTESFNVRFGSNANAFSNKLIRELAPARTEIASFIELLKDLDAAGKQAIGNAARGTAHLQKNVPSTATTDAGGSVAKIDMSGVEREMQSVTADLSNLTGKLGDFITKLGRASSDYNRNTGAQDRVAGGGGNFQNPANGRFLGSNPAKSGAQGPAISNAQHAKILQDMGKEVRRQGESNTKAVEQVVKAAQSERDRAAAPAAPVKAEITGLTKIQLDQGGFDRIVNKLEEVKAAIEARGGARRVAAKVDQQADEAGTSTTSSKKGKSKGGKSVAQEAEVTADEFAGLQKDLEEARKMVVERFGASAPKEVTDLVEGLRQKVAAASRATERATTGVSRSDQSAAARSKAAADRKKFDDLDRAEYDARKRQLALIQNAGRADFEETATKRGKGGMSQAQLIETAQAFQNQGFDVQYGSKTTKAQLASNIKSARAAFEAEHGSDIPDSLKVGRTPQGPAVISDQMRNLVGGFNPSAAELEEERKAREVRRLAYQTGHLPKDPTGRALESMPGTIGVPPGMVKGGQYSDQFGFLAASQLLDQRALGRAAVKAGDPGFNPFSVNEKENIQGNDDAAQDIRRQFRELKRATRELDELGGQYDKLADSLRDNRRGIQTLEGRIGTDQEKKGDGDRLRGMAQSVTYAERGLQSTRFAGLQDLFEDPQYQAGRRNRQQTLEDQEEARQERQKAFEDEHGAYGRTYVNDSAASAIAGAQQRIGGPGYRRPIPGLRPDGERLAFTDPERNPAELTKTNAAFRKYQSGLKRERQLAEDLANGVEGITEGHVKAEMEKTDNQITKFLNSLNKIFGKGVAPGFEDLIGRAPTTSKAINDEATRQQQRVALNALMNAKPQKATPLQTAVERSKDVAHAEAALDQATKDLADARREERAAIKKAKAATSARPADEQAQLQARTEAEHALIRANLASTKPTVEGTGGLTTRLQAFRRSRAQDAVNQIPELELSPEEQAAREASAKAATAAARQKQVKATLAARQASLADAQANIGGKDPEVATLQKKLARSQALRKELSTLRGNVRKAVEAEDEDAAADARKQRDEFKAKNAKALLTRNEQKQLRARIADLNSSGGDAGSGSGKPPTANGGAGAGGARGGGGSLDVLRQILASVNGIRETLKGGVKISGRGTTVDAEGNVTTKSRRASVTPGVEAVQKAGLTGDARDVAMAAAQEQARIEKERAAGTLSEVNALKQINRITQEAEKATRKLTAAELSQATAEESLRSSKVRLNTAASEELAKLKQLVQSGGSATDVVRQRARAYASADQALAESGVQPGGERHKQIRDLIGDAEGAKITGPATDEIRRNAASINGFKTVDQQFAKDTIPGGIFGEQSAFTKAMFGNHGFWSRVMASTGTFVVRNFTAGFVFGLTNALQEVVRQAIITESTFIRVSDALEQTGRSSGNLRTQLQGISSAYGTSLEDVYETAAGLTGLFDKIDDIAGATRVVSQLQSISMGALNAQEAMGALASITGAYGDQLKDGTDGLSQVADVLTTVQNVIGTNVETTAEGVGALSGLSKQLKIDFQDTAVYVAQIAKLTNQTGAAAGDQFSRILAAMQTGRGRQSLVKNLGQVDGKSTGIETQLGSGNYGGALQTLLKNWDKLSDGQQRNIAVTVAGQRQARAFYALVSNSSKVLDASARAHNAEGQAAQRAAAIANTLNQQVAKLTSNLTNLAQNLVRTGLLDFFGVLLHLVNDLLAGVNHVFSVFNDVADSSPVLSFLKHLTAGLAGFLVTAKLAQLAFRGFRSSLAELRAGDGVVAAGVNGALGTRGTAASAPSLRSALFNAPGNASGALRERAGSLRGNVRPVGTDYIPAPGSLTPGPTYGPGRTVRVERPIQGPAMANGGFYSPAARAAGSVEQEASRASRVLATGASGASKALGGVSNSLNAVKSSSLAAQVGMAGIFAVLFAGIDGLSEHASRADDYRKLYKEQYGTNSATDGGPGALSTVFNKIGSVFGNDDQKKAEAYVGPITEQYEKNVKQTSGFWGGLKTGLASGVQGLNPSHWNDPGFLSLNASPSKLGIAGNLPDDVQKMITDTVAKTGRRAPKLSSVNVGSNGVPIGSQTGLDRALAERTVGQGEIDAARKKIDANTNLTEEQKTAALAQLEKLQKAFSENISTKILAAQGVASRDILTPDQLSKLDGVQQNLLGTATSGGGVDARNPKYAALFKKRLSDTGVRAGSTIGTALSTLAQGGLNKGDALEQVRIVNDEAIKQLQARLESAKKNGNDDEIDQLQTALDGFVSNQSQILQQIIDAVGATAAAVADAASGRGNFGGAARTIEGARNKSAGLRDRGSESSEVRATRDSAEAGQSEKAASLLTQGRTAGLNAEKARGVGARRGAQIDAETARVAYQDLQIEKASAKIAGAQGPTVQAIRDAKNAWLSAQRASAVAAQDANIASMTAAAAGLWNGIASAAAQEDIALQQYSDAKKNFGANSTEALNALAAYKGAQKSTQTTLDQVAESTRAAAIASIPQGDAVRIARANVTSARAALAAAEKYGHNSTEYQGALAALASAQQGAVSAQQAVTAAQGALAEAYANARGDTVGAARAAEKNARQALAAARKASGGARSADVINAQAAAVTARAATRDAILQDREDTIDFNLQMGKITQSSAIAAMQQILRTANLTKQQRRDLLLKIKGMKDEIADSQWNFDSVSLPTPYQMRRYVRAEAMNAAQKNMTPYKDSTSMNLTDRASRGGEPGSIDNRSIYVNGADIGAVRKVIEDVLGKSVKTRTAQGRRR